MKATDTDERGWYDDDDEDDDEYHGGTSDGGREYDIQELIDSEITLTHWTGPDGTRLEETSLSVDGDEVCATTSSVTSRLTPRSTRATWATTGNTLDRWYHRAAVVVWPRQRAFANRAETSPAWALDELAAIACARRRPGSAGRRDDARAVLGRGPARRGPGQTPRQGAAVAAALDDPETAAMLLRPFRTRT